ncbi:MAG: GtrA family protein [Lachnospiraceae bacterium]|nr:GtrA family protein [Lachnospiraceae bacterium]
MNFWEKHKKLFFQLLKFAFVGGTAFVIDFVITMLVSALCRKLSLSTETAALIGGIFGFTISLIYNYFMSMRFVFERREDMNRRTEFLIFTILSLIGLALNAAILYFGVLAFKGLLPAYSEEHPSYVTAAVKIVATAIVMIYNFISRKLTLEKKEDGNETETETEL